MRFGRLTVFLNPRMPCVGVLVTDEAVYVCPLPTLILRWRRG